MEYECVLHIFLSYVEIGLSPNPKKPDSPLTPLQERGIVTTGKRGLSML